MVMRLRVGSYLVLLVKEKAGRLLPGALSGSQDLGSWLQTAGTKLTERPSAGRNPLEWLTYFWEQDEHSVLSFD